MSASKEHSMGQVSFTANLQRHVDCPPAGVVGGTVGEALEAIFADNPRLRSYVLDEHGRLRKHVNVFVNETAVVDRERLSDPVSADDDVYVFQALSGG
jgi:molybdopterin converting factor small subunit